MSKRITTLFIAFLSIQAIASENLVIPLSGGEIRPRGMIELNTSKFAPGHDYTIRCEFHDPNNSNHQSFFCATNNSDFTSDTYLNGNKIHSHIWMPLPQENNMLMITPARKSDWITINNYDDTNTLIIDNCAAVLHK